MYGSYPVNKLIYLARACLYLISDFALTPFTNNVTNYISRMEINLTDLDIDEGKPQEKRAS